ncbi:hypothetical protein KAK05_00025 [Candidatus Parcubacteria bacterium]|nr:hypothetical protein [Candidatus Parcubacteria bacterium]
MSILEKKFELYLYFCVAMFFFLLGIVLFYSFGYKYNINENRTVRTGAIIIKSTPEDVDIFINDKIFINNRTITNLFSDFVKIEELKNDTYNIKIKKSEHFQWEKNIKVNSGYITELKNIVLLKNNYNKNILLNKIKIDHDSNNLFVSNNKDRIIYTKDINKVKSLFIYNINNNSEIEISRYNKFMFNKFKNEYSIENIIWSDNNSKIIIKTKDKKSTESYLIDLEDNYKIYDVNSIFKNNNYIRNNWNFHFNDVIFFIEEGTLFEYNFKKLTSTKIMNNISSFIIKNGYIYYIKQNDNILYYKYLNTSSTENKIIILPKNNIINPTYKIIASDINTYLILSSDGILYFIDERNSIHTINHSVDNASFSNNNKRILYNNDHEIWIYYIEEKISQPSKKKATNELITRFSGNINNISLYKDEEHIFYKEGDAYKLIEIDSRDKRNIYEIINLTDNNIFYFNSLNSLYYLKNDKFIQLDLNEQ